ncbi:oxidoreductase [Flammeovirga sp. SJP92]|uniref:oxidoreductase n=1 Tax=Flammeovirga sp. SJP92 TaxID=1775430 RepID=UPI0007889DE2|nr:oxidoreductase [Flammeovirga sp. SJP92]KXX66903.1 short-chain dehydrogenase [Flammeovirga sp. SJP92]
MMSNWTVDNMPSQKGKTFLVTGANSGLGFGTSVALAKKGAKVIMTARDLSKGTKAMFDLKKEAPTADVELMQLDLADLNQVKAFANAFKEKYQQLDVLINNAGVMMPAKRDETKQGFEIQFGTNHLGHFVLTNELLEILEKTPDSRIVVLSSLVAKMNKADIYWDDLHFEKSYDKMASYAQSKLANMLFAAELDRRLKKQRSAITCIMAHPGYTATNLQQHMGWAGRILNFLMAQKVEMGILPTLRAATDPNAKGGEYYGPAKMGNYRGYPVLNEPNKMVDDNGANQKLWQLSEQLTNTNFVIHS